MFLPLSSDEKIAFTLIQKHLVYSHASSQAELIEKEGRLSSLKVRQYSRKFTGNRHTSSQSATDGNIFATAELGDDPAPPIFLGQGIDFFRIHPEEYQHEFPLSALTYVWTSPHLSEYQRQTMHYAEFGDTVYQIRHHSNRTKTYTYSYEDGSSHSRTITLAEEIFMGETVPIAIALQLIEHLRLLKNGYPKELFARLSDETITENDKVKLLYEVMQYTWPSSMYPEIKIPGALDISRGVQIKRQKQKHKIESMQRFTSSFFDRPWAKRQPKKALSSKDQAIEYIKEGNVPTLKKMEQVADAIAEIDQSRPGAVGIALIYIHSNKKLIPMLEFLYKLGASSCDEYYDDSAMHQAIEKRNYLLLKFLVELRIASPLDPNLKFRLKINQAHPSSFRNAVAHACEKGDLVALKILQKAGVALDRFPQYWINTAADYRHLPVVLFFAEIGFDFTGPFTKVESPLLTFARHNDIDGVTKMLAIGCRVNAQCPARFEHFEFTGLHFAATHGNEEMAKLLLQQKGINVDAQSASLETPLSIAHHLGHRQIKNLLLEHGAKKSLILPTRPKYQSYRHLAVAVVTGTNNKGQRVVVLGRKWSREGGMLKRMQFPGGIKENTDSDFTTAAAREFAEETNFPLDKLLHQGKISARVIFSYHKGIDNEMCKIVFVHFELGKQFHALLKQHPLRAQDDLAQVNVVLLEELKVNKKQKALTRRYTITHKEEDSVPLLASNGLILDMLKTRSNGSNEALNWACDIENFGTNLAKLAVRTNDVNLLEQLSAEGIAFLFYCYSQDCKERYTLWGYACRVANTDVLRCLLPHYKNHYDIGNPHPLALAIRDNPHSTDILALFTQLKLFSDIGCLAGLHAALTAKKETLAIACIEQAPQIANMIYPAKQYPLTEAVKYRCNQVIAVMLNKGAKVNPSSEGFSTKKKNPLTQAIESDNQEAFDMLLEKGADVNCMIEHNEEERSQMHSAISFGMMTGLFTVDPKDIFEGLPSFGEPKKQCPLSVAIRFNRVEMAKVLYHRKGIDLDLAAECVEILKQSGLLHHKPGEINSIIQDLLEPNKAEDKGRSASSSVS